MFSEKERSIIQALIEDEIVQVEGREQEEDGLLNMYRFTLSNMLMKLNVDGFNAAGDGYSNLLDGQFLSRQSI